MVNVHPGVRDELYKVASVNMCPNTTGQVPATTLSMVCHGASAFCLNARFFTVWNSDNAFAKGWNTSCITLRFIRVAKML